MKRFEYRLKMTFCDSVKIVFLIITGLLVLTTSAHAHRVNVFAWVEGDTVFVESKFSGGRKVKDGLITVTDASGAQLLRGKTDARGEFSFKIPRRTELHIILQAGMGHRAQWILPVTDIPPDVGSADSGAQSAAVQEKNEQTAAAMDQSPAVKAGKVLSGPDAKQIEAVVEKVLDRKLKPLYKMIAESRQTGPTLADVLGGIGYIIGLVGLAAYVRYRKKNA